MNDYNELISRNWGFINKKVQNNIKNSGLLIAGCGLGSGIAELAARIGFAKFFLVDGDKIEYSNLNRQSFSIGDLRVLKTKALQKKIKSINPGAEVFLVDKKIKKAEDLMPMIEKCSVVINTFDISNVYFDLIALAGRACKPIFLPFNVGFGACLICVHPKKVDDFIRIFSDNKSDVGFLLDVLKKSKNIKLPFYLKMSLPRLILGLKKGQKNPQIGIASFLTSAMVATEIIKYLAKEKIKFYPEINYFDLKKY